MDVESAFKANAQLTEAREPRVRAVHDPAVLAQALAALYTSPSNAARDAPLPQMCDTPPVVVALVRMQFDGSLARPARQTSAGRHRIDASFEDHRVVPVRSTYQYHQWDAARMYDEVALGAELASVRGLAGAMLIDLIVLTQPSEHGLVQLLPNTGGIPVP